MIRQPLVPALREIGSRNAAIAAAYRAWAKRLPPGPVSKLASSMAEQRLDLGKALASIAGDRALPGGGIEVEFEVDPSSLTGADAFGPAESREQDADPVAFLRKMADTEAADHELLAAIAGAVLPASSDAAERLAAEAASARKRSIWAQDQLDLLSM